MLKEKMLKRRSASKPDPGRLLWGKEAEGGVRGEKAIVDGTKNKVG